MLIEVFQSLDWVERLSDRAARQSAACLFPFQSLDWVERLSDHASPSKTRSLFTFQSLDWVERLSDQIIACCTLRRPLSFNPSTGLSVFQTHHPSYIEAMLLMFQSLDWVERLSDRNMSSGAIGCSCFNPSTGLSVFQTVLLAMADYANEGFNPSTGLSVFQTCRRLSRRRPADVSWRFNPSTGLSVFQTWRAYPGGANHDAVSIPRLG